MTITNTMVARFVGFLWGFVAGALYMAGEWMLAIAIAGVASFSSMIYILKELDGNEQG